jgi:hypothetical protein
LSEPELNVIGIGSKRGIGRSRSAHYPESIASFRIEAHRITIGNNYYGQYVLWRPGYPQNSDFPRQITLGWFQMERSAAPFIPPTDPEYRQLREEYSFNDQALRNQFISVSNQINLDNMMLAKQHNLIIFRLLCGRPIPLPKELFLYDIQAATPQESTALKQVVMWSDKVVSYDLTTEISSVYPEVQWIPLYFVVSSFPAIYGHFISDEYLQYGLQFIKGHIHDRLAPQLVGTYLLHAFLFRDRLQQLFFKLLAQRASDTHVDVTGSWLWELFKDAFAFCVPYFTEFHIQAAHVLRAVSQGLAIEAVFRYFLKEVVRLWDFSPLFAATDLIIKRSPNDPRRTDNILLIEVAKVEQDNHEAERFLDFFTDGVNMQMPRIGSIILYGGTKFPLSVVDVCLIQKLHALLKMLNGGQNRPVTGAVESAITDAFRIRTRQVHYLQATVSEPKQTETSPHLTRKRLEEHKAIHDFLFQIAGGLKQFHTSIAAQRNICALQYRSLARHIFEGYRTMPAASFTIAQRRLYAMQLFRQWVRAMFLDYVRSKTEGDFNDFHNREIAKRITQGISSGQSVTAAVLEQTSDYINDWKRRFNAEYPTNQQGPCNPNAEYDYPFCQFFSDAVDEVTFALILEQLSDCPMPVDKLKKNLQSLSDGWPFLTFSLTDSMNDPEVPGIIENSLDVKFFLARTELALKRAFESGDIKWGTGSHMLLFLEIEKVLAPMLIDGAKGDQELSRKVMCALFQGDDPLYSRTCLAKVMMTVQQLRQVANPLVGRLAEIGNPINERIVNRVRNLVHWFGLKDTLLVVG